MIGLSGIGLSGIGLSGGFGIGWAKRIGLCCEVAVTAVKGSPKGIGVEEANILALPAWINPRYAIW